MSFSMEIKEELRRRTANARHCRIAQLSALTVYLARLLPKDAGSYFLEYRTETSAVSELLVSLIEKLLSERPLCSTIKNGRQTVYVIQTKAGAPTDKLLEIIKGANWHAPERSPDGQQAEEAKETLCRLPNPLLLQRSCCKRAYLKGAFLAVGSVSDPKKSYHFELVFACREQAKQMQELLQSFDVEAGVVARKKASVLYVKEGSQISDLLNRMEAHVALMEFENVRILKEMRNSINRQVNCEAANINKTVTTAARQIEAIQRIRDTVGLEGLKEELREIAALRLAHPESSLKELGALLSPPIGKSGVNHRLSKLCELADNLGSKEIENPYE